MATPAPDDQLLDLAVAGDRKALEFLLMDAHDPLLHYISTRLTRNASLIAAEDVLQETFLEAFRSITTLTPRGHIAFFAWLKTIARTRYLNLVEAQQAKKRGGDHHRVVASSPPDATAVSLLAQIAGADPTPSWIARRKEVLHAVAIALTGLEQSHRDLLDLRYREGLPFEQIATRLGRTEGAIKMSLNRIIRDLREALSKYFGESAAGA